MSDKAADKKPEAGGSGSTGGTPANKDGAGPSPHRGGGGGGPRGRGGFTPRGNGGFSPRGAFRGRGGRGGFHGGPPNEGDGQDGSPSPMRGRGGRGGGRGGPGGRGGGFGGRFDRTLERLQAIVGQPTFELPPLEMGEKPFSGRARLYVGNLTPDTTEEQLKELMSQFGEVGEMFYNPEKNFGFLRLQTRADAEKAKRELDGKMRNGRAMKVRFAPHQAAIKVSNLGPWVSNELLYLSFSIFGDIERCFVHVDDRGRSKGEGVVEFERKPSALEALRKCQEGCFFLTAALRPVIVQLLDETDDEDGLQEKMLPKRSPEYNYERETGPRFAEPSSFEFEYGQKWKALYEMKKQKLEALEREMKLEEDKLIAQMEYARYEHETEQLREQLRQREQSRERTKNQWEERERHMQTMMMEEQERRKRDEEDMINRMQRQEENMRQRQQENSLFMQAQQLNSMLDQQEATMRGGMGGGGPMGGGMGDGNGDGGWENYYDGPPRRGGPPMEPKAMMGGFNDSPRGGGFHGSPGPRGGGFNRRGGFDDGPGGKRRRF